MTRICTAAALIALTAAAQAEPSALETRIHDAAVKACAVETIPKASLTSLYGAIEDHCVYRVSREAMHKHLARNGEQPKLASK